MCSWPHITHVRNLGIISFQHVIELLTKQVIIFYPNLIATQIKAELVIRDASHVPSPVGDTFHTNV